MKRLESPVCPCCDCEVRPARVGIARFFCPFCRCEYGHNFWHWLVGLTLLAGAGYVSWKVLNMAFTAGFTLEWQAKLFLTVIGAFGLTWPIVGMIPRYRVIVPGDPPGVSTPISMPPKRVVGAIVSPRNDHFRNKSNPFARRSSRVARPAKDY